MNNEIEIFYDEIKEHDGIFKITIPKKVIEFGGYKVGDKIKVMIKRQSEINQNRGVNNETGPTKEV